VNLYGYCLGDPVGLADPAGLFGVYNPRGTVTDKDPANAEIVAEFYGETVAEGAAGGAGAAGTAATAACNASGSQWWEVVRQKGLEGEAALARYLSGLGETWDKARVYSADRMSYRVPDAMTRTAGWFEAKNVAVLRITAQLRQTAEIAKLQEQSYTIFVRVGTLVPPGVQAELDRLGIHLVRGIE
jgi:hypothetical protein